jgi:DNA-binding PadR family transcriptional regulator
MDKGDAAMLSDPITLYKLMILYMLEHVNFPLTNAQLTDFFLEHEYTTYFTLQQAINELLEAGLIKKEALHNSSRYEITKEGEDTLSFFGNNISSAIVTDIDGYLKENKFRLRTEVGIVADYYKSTAQDYVVHCEVREGKVPLIGLDVSVPDKEQAELMCSKWKERSQEIYSYVMKTLMKA